MSYVNWQQPLSATIVPIRFSCGTELSRIQFDDRNDLTRLFYHYSSDIGRGGGGRRQGRKILPEWDEKYR